MCVFPHLRQQLNTIRKLWCRTMMFWFVGFTTQWSCWVTWMRTLNKSTFTCFFAVSQFLRRKAYQFPTWKPPSLWKPKKTSDLLYNIWYFPFFFFSVWCRVVHSLVVQVQLRSAPLENKASLIAQLVKNPPAGDPHLIPGLGRFTREGIGYPLQHSWTSLVARL